MSSSTLGCDSARYQRFEGRIRLQPKRVAGRDLRQQPRVGDLAAHVAAGDALRELHQPRALDEAEHEQLAAAVDAGPHELLQPREAPVEPRLDGPDRAARVRHDPRRRALDDVQLRDVLLDRGHELDRGGAGADGGHALAPEVVAVVPARGVERLALEGLEPGERRRPGLGQRPHPRDDDACAQRAVRGLDAPAALRPLDAGHVAAGPQVRPDAVLVGDAPQVVADLGLARVGLAPARVGREGERVEMRGHVAGAARIGVGVPRAAHVGRALEHGEVLDPFLLEADRHPEAREAAADDRDVDVGHARDRRTARARR